MRLLDHFVLRRPSHSVFRRLDHLIVSGAVSALTRFAVPSQGAAADQVYVSAVNERFDQVPRP
jgi:hypothetical protein